MKFFQFTIFIVVIISLILISYTLSFAKEDITGTIKINKKDIKKFPEKAGIDFNSAIDRALKEVPGKLLEIELKAEEGYLVYEVEIVTREKEIKEIIIDAGNGEVLSIDLEENEEEEDYEDPHSETRLKEGSIKPGEAHETAFPDLAEITFEEALTLALKKVPGSLLEMEMEVEDDYLVYEFEILDFKEEIKEIIVDPVTGEILRVITEYEEMDEENIYEEDTIGY